MVRKDRLPELLAPAGDFDCLVAAVKGGADAVYIGAKAFGARAFAKNFEIEEIERAVAYCHFHGVKLYVTLNTLIKDSEMAEALRLAEALYVSGVDALIVCDLGLIRNIRRLLPDFELHASTQMSIHNSLGADEAYSLGCTRVVLARELTGADIAAVTAACKAETEVFLHGALCVCHSGQCLFSSLVGGRSGNRGECAQPCRLPYGKGYPLSLCDLSLSGHVRELIASGVASLKIEGRMKAPEYVYTVTSIYRRLLDEGREATKEEDGLLRRAFSRGDFTDGYFVGNTKGKMTGVRTVEDKQATKELSGFDLSIERIPLRASAIIKRGSATELNLRVKDEIRGFASASVTVRGSSPSEAISSPLDERSVTERLAKMGNTLFSLDPCDIEIYLDEGLNLPPSALNALRRDAAQRRESAFKRELPQRSTSDKEQKSTAVKNRQNVLKTALFYEPSVFDGLKSEDRGYLDLIFIPLHRLEEAENTPDGISLPPVIMESEISEVKKMLSLAKDRGIGYALVGNLGHKALAEEYGLIPYGDFRLNIYNKDAADAVCELFGERYVVSAELEMKDCERLLGAGIVYGRIPLMLTERCFIRENGGCERCNSFALRDRRGANFPIIREYRHRNLILNSVVTYMGDKFNTPPRLKPFSGHFIFTAESTEEVSRIISAFKVGAPMPLPYPFRRMGRREAGKSK